MVSPTTSKQKSLETWIWDAACSIRGAQDAPKYKDFILPLIFAKRLCDVFDDEINRIAKEVGSRAKAFKLVDKDHKLVRFYLPLRPQNVEEPVWTVIRTLTGTIGQTLTGLLHDVAKANPQLEGIIDRIDFNATTHGQRDLDDDRLSNLIEKVSEKRLGLTDVEADIIGRSYEYLTRGEPLKQTEIGPVPESWTTGSLREFMKIKHGYAFDGKYFRGEGDRILMTPGHFDEAGGFREQGARTKFYVGEVPKGYTLTADNLVIAMTEQKSGLLGSAALVPASGTYLHNQRLGLVHALDESRLINRFLYFFLNRPETKMEVGRTATGSKVRHTSPGKLLDLVIGLPGLGEQRLIASVLNNFEAKRHAHLSTLRALSNLFRTLLHQLMTVQVRVHDLDLSALEAGETLDTAGASAGIL